MLKFNFTNPGFVSEEEFAAAAEKKGGAFFEPGNYDLIVNQIRYLEMAKKDPSWASFEITLTDGKATLHEVPCKPVPGQPPKTKLVAKDAAGKDVKSIRHFLYVPTQKVTYGEKQSTFMFVKFREFMAALGETITCDKAGLSIIPKYFKDPAKLQGVVLNVDIGYDGPYAKFVAKDDYRLAGADGKNICEDAFSSRQAAEAEAANRGIALSNFVNVLKFAASQTAPKAETVVEEEW
jgi:hypothetical protein